MGRGEGLGAALQPSQVAQCPCVVPGLLRHPVQRQVPPAQFDVCLLQGRVDAESKLQAPFPLQLRPDCRRVQPGRFVLEGPACKLAGLVVPGPGLGQSREPLARGHPSLPPQLLGQSQLRRSLGHVLQCPFVPTSSLKPGRQPRREVRRRRQASLGIADHGATAQVQELRRCRWRQLLDGVGGPAA